MPAAMGTRATIVPTLVPIEKEMKHAAMKRPASRNFCGRSVSVRFTVASTVPMDLATLAKAPAITNIQIISSTLWSPAPLEKIPIRSEMLPGVMIIA